MSLYIWNIFSFIFLKLGRSIFLKIEVLLSIWFWEKFPFIFLFWELAWNSKCNKKWCDFLNSIHKLDEHLLKAFVKAYTIFTDFNLQIQIFQNDKESMNSWQLCILWPICLQNIQFASFWYQCLSKLYLKHS